MGRALATAADVKRMLKIPLTDTSKDADIVSDLETATEHVTLYLRQDFTQDVGGTAIFYDVREDGTFPVPVLGAAITAARFFKTPSATAYTGHVLVDYEIHEGREVRLHTTFFDVPFEGAVSSHVIDSWSRIEVDYTVSGSPVPFGVRDGTAMTAAAIFARSQLAAGGLSSETIGDYSYSIKQNAASVALGNTSLVPELARALLRPFRRRRSMVPR